MADVLIVYGTGEGQTASVGDRIGSVLRARGHATTVVDASDDPPDDLAAYDAVIVGASIHMGAHQSTILNYVEGQREALARMPTAFFQLSLSSATDEGREQAATYVDEFLERTGWDPDRIGLFGGALRYSKYGFLKRFMMKRIATRQLPDVETGEDVELTDWHEVEAFADDVAAFVESREHRSG